jgi:hypothetical protein
VAVLLLLGLTVGCTGKVDVPAPTPDPAAAPVCDAVLADLPATVLGASRRDTTAGGYTAAWGKPAITVRCGVPAPAELTPTSECLEVDGVGWFEQRQQDGSLFTTIGRTAYVELAVPAHYAPESGGLADLAPVISAHDPVRTPCAA